MAAKKKTRTAKKSSKGGRGSAEAVEKRKVARQLNTLLSEGTGPAKLDGRTEIRRQRLVAELKATGDKTLKPMVRVQHTNELLAIGESFASLKKQGVKADKVNITPEIEATLVRSQAAYGFAPEAWRILGVKMGEDGTLQKPSPRKKTTKRKTRRRS